MKVAAPYTFDAQYTDIPDEYNIKYTTSASPEKLFDFCELFPQKPINILYEDVDIDIETLKNLCKLYPKVKLMLRPQQANRIAEIKENNIPFFFSSDFPCYSLSLLDMMVEFGVTDIYISDFLCYNLDKVKEICKKNNIQVRLIINSIPSLSPEKGQDIKSPMFFPRDMRIIKNYIDVVEFTCGEGWDWIKFKAYHDIWIKDEDWFGDLNEIVPELQLSYPTRSVLPGLTEYKFNCGRRCSLGSSCIRCKQIYEMSNTLNEKDMYIPKKNLGNLEQNE